MDSPVPLLPKPVALALGILLTVVEALQVSIIHVQGGFHDAITLGVIVVAGLGVVPLAPAAIFKLLPVHVAAYLTALAGICEVVQRSVLHIGLGAHVVLSVVLTLTAALGIVPRTPSHAAVAAAATRSRRR